MANRMICKSNDPTRSTRWRAYLNSLAAVLAIGVGAILAAKLQAGRDIAKLKLRYTVAIKNAAIKADGPQWSKVTDHPIGKRRSIAYAGPIDVYQERQGALAIIIEYSRLAHFLAQLVRTDDVIEAEAVPPCDEPSIKLTVPKHAEGDSAPFAAEHVERGIDQAEQGHKAEGTVGNEKSAGCSDQPERSGHDDQR